MGVYSKKIKDLKALKKAIRLRYQTTRLTSYERCNFSKLLVLLAQGRYQSEGNKADVVSNPLGLKIEELEASQLPTHFTGCGRCCNQYEFCI